ncbi:MAG: hypothetical protein JSR29_11010 [Nitrospira sp.]|nr:hypothetical protein [Nitrospira sp.]
MSTMRYERLIGVDKIRMDVDLICLCEETRMANVCDSLNHITPQTLQSRVSVNG